jgi:hypothetical protein
VKVPLLVKKIGLVLGLGKKRKISCSARAAGQYDATMA